MAADLVLLHGDPLADIKNTGRIAAAIAGARLYPREALAAMLAEAKADWAAAR